MTRPLGSTYSSIMNKMRDITSREAFHYVVGKSNSFPLKKIFLSVCAILVLTTLQFGQGLENGKMLVHSNGSVRWSQCAFGPDGILWVVYQETGARGNPIWVVSYDGTTVSTPFNITGSLEIYGERPHVATGSKGQIIVTWGVTAAKTVYMRVRDPRTKSWLPLETVKAGSGAYEPCAAVDTEGNIHVFWSDDVAGQTFSRSKIYGVWGDAIRLSYDFGDQGAIGIGPNGTVWALWREMGASGLYFNYYSSRTKTTAWLPAQLLATSDGNSTHPWLAVGPDNIAVAAWADVDPERDSGGEIRVMKIIDGAAWEVALLDYIQHYPRIAIDKDNIIHLVCQIGGGDYGDGLKYTNNRDGSWKEPQVIPAVWNKLAGLATNLLGNVAVCQSSISTTGSGADIWAFTQDPIVPVPAPSAQFTFTPQTGTVPLAVEFKAIPYYSPDGQEVNYDWVFGDGETASGRNVTHLFNTGGTYQVRLMVIDNINRSDSLVQPIEIIKAIPLPPLSLSARVTFGGFWKKPSIAYKFSWAINPENIPVQIVGYAIYMKEDNGDYTRLITVSSSTLSANFTFEDLKKKRSFAFSTLGIGGTESEKVYLR